MSEQSPYGTPPPPSRPPAVPYGAPPPPAAPPAVPPYGPPGYPEAYVYPQPPPRRSRRTLWITLGCVGGALLLGGGLLGYFLLDTESTTGTHKVVLPESFRGVKRDPGSPLAQQLETSIQEQFDEGHKPWAPTAVSSVYADKEAGRAVVVFGGYGDVLDPGSQVDEFLGGFEKGPGGQGSTFAGRQGFDAGPLGGTLACELMKAPTETDSLCVWGDGSAVVAVLTGEANATNAPDLAQAAATARELRQLAEIAK